MKIDETKAAQRDRENADREIASGAYRFEGMTDVQVVIDIGAYHGSFVRGILSLYPDASIHAFEPNPHSFRRLKQTVPAGHELHNKAVAGTAESILFEVGVVPSCSALVGRKPPQRGASETITVDAVVLPEYILSIGNPVIDILKIDCEGSEAEILESFLKSTHNHLRNIRYITAEWHGQDQLKRCEAALSNTHRFEYELLRKKGNRGGYFFAHLLP